MSVCVAKLGVLAGWMLPLLAPGGTAVAYKSRDIAREVEESRTAITAAGGKIKRMVEVLLPGTDIIRKLVLLTTNASPSGRGREKSILREG